MENIIRFSAQSLYDLTSFRKGEIKFGERIVTIPENVAIEDYLKTSEEPFVLVGIPEDIGVKANFGRTGTASAWDNTLKSLVNIQHNRFAKGYNILLLGTLDTSSQMEKAKKLNPEVKEELKELYKLVEEIDKDVVHIISTIVANGKIPIVIGGGHNNSYGIIKGTALGKAESINCINFDAHTDFRALEGRHSGNGFSYAFEEGFLNRYFVFGLHENYTSKTVFQRIKQYQDRVKYNTYEQIAIRKEKSFSTEMQQALDFVSTQHFGIEMDLDALAGFPSSAMTLSGFAVEKARYFLNFFASHPKAAYLHICEAAPNFSDEQNPNLVGKLISYLITDFIKAKTLE